MPRRALHALALTLPSLGACARPVTSASGLSILAPVNESGEAIDRATSARLRDAIDSGLRARLPLSRDRVLRPSAEVRVQLVRLPSGDAAGPLPEPGTPAGGLAVVTVLKPAGGRVAFDSVASVADTAGLDDLGDAVAAVVVRGLRRGTDDRPPEMGEEITATGAPVRHLGDGRFSVDGRLVDARAIAHGHDPAVDPDVPAATNIVLDAPSPTRGLEADQAVITLYQVDPPLTGLPSREPGIDRGTDFRDPANLVKAAYTNYVSPVLTDDPLPVRVPSHPIGHFFVRIDVPGYPTLLTGMTTIARADRELLDLTLGRQLGIGGVLLTPQPGRLNSAAEVARELALRQRRLRVVDGLYFHPVNGRNLGPEYRFDDGRVVFARVRLPTRNAKDALAYFAEHVARGGHDRFGSLLNRTFKGTGAGCAAFAMSWLQAAGVIPFITEPAPRPPPVEVETLGPEDFWRALHASVHIAWRDIGCDGRVGAAADVPAERTVYDLLFHGETPGFVRAASEGLADRIRASFGTVPATLFQLGVLTPLRDLVVNAHRKDPADQGDYTWSGPGLDVAYWDNSRFSAWIRRTRDRGPRDPRVTLAREGRFIGLEIDATGAARQREPFFAAADRRIRERSAATPPAMDCAAAFGRNLE